MITIIFGLACIAFVAFACLPFGLGWGNEVLFVLKGAVPILAGFVGLLAILIGIADIRDRNEALREEQESLNSEKQENKS
ncbi:MAG: hypothetical protein II821_02920 [Treponema sp.]|jgi:hypothetical protein|nr:hypothetical protein [Treponema sp.]